MGEAIIGATEGSDPFDNLVKSRFIEMIKSKNYPLKTIGESCVATRVGPFGSALHKTEMVPEGPVFVLGTDNAVDNEFKVYEERYISSEKYSELERYTVVPGDIIITMMGTIGRSAVIPENFKKSIISSHLSCLSVDTKVVLPEYLQKCMVLDHDVSKHLDSNKKGSIMSGLNLKIIKAIPFSCPPINVQKQFMTFVEQVDKSKVIYKQIVERFDNLVKSRFIEMFGHQDRNEKGFKVSTIGESCIIRDSERIPVTSSEREPGPYPYYGANGLQDYVNDYIFDGDFVLMAEDGGYFDDPERPIAYAVSGKCWVNNHAHILEPGREMNVHYLEWALKYRDITNVINGTTRSKLTQAAMRSIQLLVPPIELQDNFASFLLQVDKSKFDILQHITGTMSTSR